MISAETLARLQVRLRELQGGEREDGCLLDTLALLARLGEEIAEERRAASQAVQDSPGVLSGLELCVYCDHTASDHPFRHPFRPGTAGERAPFERCGARHPWRDVTCDLRRGHTGVHEPYAGPFWLREPSGYPPGGHHPDEK